MNSLERYCVLYREHSIYLRLAICNIFTFDIWFLEKGKFSPISRTSGILSYTNNDEVYIALLIYFQLKMLLGFAQKRLVKEVQ